jgi:hypothetical protein
MKMSARVVSILFSYLLKPRRSCPLVNRCYSINFEREHLNWVVGEAHTLALMNYLSTHKC